MSTPLDSNVTVAPMEMAAVGCRPDAASCAGCCVPQDEESNIREGTDAMLSRANTVGATEAIEGILLGYAH